MDSDGYEPACTMTGAWQQKAARVIVAIHGSFSSCHETKADCDQFDMYIHMRLR